MITTGIKYKNSKNNEILSNLSMTSLYASWQTNKRKLYIFIFNIYKQRNKEKKWQRQKENLVTPLLSFLRWTWTRSKQKQPQTTHSLQLRLETSAEPYANAQMCRSGRSRKCASRWLTMQRRTAAKCAAYNNETHKGAAEAYRPRGLTDRATRLTEHMIARPMLPIGTKHQTDRILWRSWLRNVHQNCTRKSSTPTLPNAYQNLRACVSERAFHVQKNSRMQQRVASECEKNKPTLAWQVWLCITRASKKWSKKEKSATLRKCEREKEK